MLAVCSIALLWPARSRAYAQPLAAPSAATVSHGQFDNILLLRPAGTVQQFVMLFTGGDAPAPGDRQLADTMVARGAMVALVPLDPFYRRLMTDSKVFQDKVAAMLDMTAMALRCDITRSVSICWADDGGYRPITLPWLDINSSFHDIAHLGQAGYADKSKADI